MPLNSTPAGIQPSPEPNRLDESDDLAAPAPIESGMIQSRYGRTPSRKRRDRRILWGLGSIFVLVLGAWVLWTGLDGASTQIEARDIGHTIIDEHTVSVTFEVALPVNRTASCAVQALNESYSVVGWKIIDLPPSTLYNRSFTELLRTTDLSNTGLIYECWLT
ncbi:DUF4307 domain-containing protein [Cryobacterium sp. TMT1-3]|uniref:DUF4307 domain-containing protein n=1 Tax=Cryobacterium luteum TaxID=1424661 RepID=A0A1H8DTL8_9MICO|nr:MULTISPECIES: DUF4307 domain-containing protein [Cryobacterium]TFB89721.1 DUF4307 domain-containing protein [Cryobacterium luteum]TFC25433.1 DUF4307 domain-containing protein [Cryobacterium sp. TMT1-3]SEN10516.1 protein of unknown function [Cryobacterium luteum]